MSIDVKLRSLIGLQNWFGFVEVFSPLLGLNLNVNKNFRKKVSISFLSLISLMKKLQGCIWLFWLNGVKVFSDFFTIPYLKAFHHFQAIYDHYITFL